MNLKLPRDAREFVLFQRTELLPKRPPTRLLKRFLVRFGLVDDGYEDFVKRYASSEPETIDSKYFEVMKEKAESLLEHIPKSTSSILDIGCGIAALDLFLYKGLNSPKIFLLDKTKIEKKVWYMFEEKGAFYNSLELAKETLTLNGVAPTDVTTIEAPSDGRIPVAPNSVDVVVSTISWGFHYPVKTYLASVMQLLSNNGVLIIDVREGTDGEAEIGEFFEVEVLNQTAKVKTLKCRLGPR